MGEHLSVSGVGYKPSESENEWEGKKVTVARPRHHELLKKPGTSAGEIPKTFTVYRAQKACPGLRLRAFYGINPQKPTYPYEASLLFRMTGWSVLFD